MKRELGLLCRYWATRIIWERLASNESDAKSFNVALLRLFTEAFKLPRDGSGLRYAELSTSGEEVQELAHRLTDALGIVHEPLLGDLAARLPSWRTSIVQQTIQALDLPLNDVETRMKAWAGRMPNAPDS